mmetsp:Transcript_15241/g.21374  ORF Transcript_15241/g.21374 Transcript_15241/m.21374 type:complete len:351 (-) Transcript_15241:51-1103(-)
MESSGTPSSSSSSSSSQKEAEKLKEESEKWGATTKPSELEFATPQDIPIFDLSKTEDPNFIPNLRKALQEIGFHYIVNTGVPEELINRIFEMTEKFCALPLKKKEEYLMDQGPISGTGYLPMLNTKLPTRSKPNANEAFIVKREHGPRNITLDKNQWPDEELIPGFRKTVEEYTQEMEKLSHTLLSLYAQTLSLPPEHFEPAFQDPLYRLRMTRYPPLQTIPGVTPKDDLFGISPHLDTSFITLLAQRKVWGLCVWSETKGQFVKAPILTPAYKGEFIVNTGTYLQRVSNDTYPATKHYAINGSTSEPRISVPFFLNATADFPLAVVPTCGEPKYPPESYLQGVGVAQGE